MKKGKVFFHPIEGTGTLTISWTSRPKGDGVEAKKGSGVGFFSDSGELLCAIFDEVQDFEDSQFLQFDNCRVEIVIKNGKVTYSVSGTKLGSSKKREKQKKPRSKRPAKAKARS